MADYYDEPFEVSGHFWLPGFRDNRVAGVLSFDPEEGGSLSLIGMLTPAEELFNDEVRSLNIVQGETDKKGYTLEGCRVTSQSIQAFRGAGRQRLRVARIIEGAWYDDKDPIELDRLYIDYTYITQWTGLNGIVASRPAKRDDGSYRTTVDYRDLSGYRCKLPVRGTLSLDHHVYRPFGGRGDQHFTQRVTVAFDFEEVVALEKALETASDFQDLLSLANDRTAAFEAVRFGHPDLADDRGDGVRHRIDARLYARWQARSNLSKTRTHTDYDMCFTFAQLGEMAGIERWLRVAKRFRSQLNRVSATRYGRGIFLQDTLLGRVAALESPHRTRYPKREGVNPKSGKSRPLFLTERIDQLIADAGKPFWLLFGDKKKDATPRMEAWRDRAKEERNNVSHHLGRDLNRDIEEMYYLSEAAYYLFVINLLKIAKAPRPVFDHLTRQARYQFASKHLRRFLKVA